MPVIRSEEPADADTTRAVHRAAFPTPAESALVDDLRQSGRLTVSLVAIEDGQVVGHVAFSPVTVAGSSAGLGLAPVAVLPGSQRQGVGASLVRAGLAACRAAAVPFVVVLGSPHYYGRFGFEAASRWGLSDEYGGGAAFQALELVPGSIPVNAGLVKYAPEFSRFGGEPTP
jgi:putative acetyltransferase